MNSKLKTVINIVGTIIATILFSVVIIKSTYSVKCDENLDVYYYRDFENNTTTCEVTFGVETDGNVGYTMETIKFTVPSNEFGIDTIHQKVTEEYSAYMLDGHGAGREFLGNALNQNFNYNLYQGTTLNNARTNKLNGVEPSYTYTIAPYNETITETDGYQKVIDSQNTEYSDLLDNFNNHNTSVTKEKMDSYVSELQRELTLQCTSSDNNYKNQRLVEFGLELSASRELAYNFLDYVLAGNDSDIPTSLLESGDISGLVEKILTKLDDYDDNSLMSIGGIQDFYVAIVGNFVEGEQSEIGIGGALGKVFLSVLNYATNDITQDVAESISRDIAIGLVNVFTKIDDAIIDFSPSLDQFYNYFGGVGSGNSSNTIVNLNRLFYYLGGILCVVIFLCSLFSIIINPENTKKTNDLLSLFTSFIVCLALIYWGNVVIDFIYSTSQKIWDWAFTTKGLVKDGMDKTVLYRTITLVTYDYFDIEWTYPVIGTLFNIAIGVLLLKNVLMLFAEAIERYVVACLLYFLYPLGISMGVSQTTRDTTKSYFRMVLVQIFMLFINIYFIAGFRVLLLNIDSWGKSFYGVIFVVSFLKVAQAFDGYLNSLGLSVARTTGTAGRELLSAFGTIGGMAMGLGSLALRGVNLGVKGVGATMSTGATLSGQNNRLTQTLFNIGENARTRGMGGLISGNKVSSATSQQLAQRQASVYSVNGKHGGFTSAMNGMVNSSFLNNQMKPDKILQNLGSDMKWKKDISNASFGQNGVVNANTKHGYQMAFSTDANKLKVSPQASAHSSNVRYAGKNIDGTNMFATVNYGGNHRLNKNLIGVPQSFTGSNLENSMYNGHYALTNVESTLGFDMSKSEMGRKILTDANSQYQFTLTGSGNILTEKSVNGKWEKVGYFNQQTSEFGASSSKFSLVHGWDRDTVERGFVSEVKSQFTANYPEQGVCVGFCNTDDLIDENGYTNPEYFDRSNWEAEDHLAENMEYVNRAISNHQQQYDYLCETVGEDNVKEAFLEYLNENGFYEDEMFYRDGMTMLENDEKRVEWCSTINNEDANAVVFKDENGEIHIYKAHDHLLGEKSSEYTHFTEVEINIPKKNEDNNGNDNEPVNFEQLFEEDGHTYKKTNSGIFIP